LGLLVGREVEVDYLVVGAGAMGMGFTDALIDHADARVALVDRRRGVGGHWLEAYPFVRLHQSSTFYGAASTVLGGGIQQDGPEAGLQERADQATICAYYDDLLAHRMVGSGRVEFFPGHDYVGDRTFVSLESGERLEVPAHCRIVDARYLAPEIPAETPPRFAVDGAHVIPVNDLVRVEHDPGQYVIVGSGKTATDACIWLLRERGVDPDDICWVRPRDPWMLNRALIQPDPAIYLGMVADMLRVSSGAASLDDLFLGLEDAGIMMRVDRSVVPTMAKAPTLGQWELDLLRSIENVVRLGHIRSAAPGRLDLADGSVALADDALIVNCAADGLKNPGRIPIWQSDAITLQTIRAGFPCFGAALAGYVEATRDDDAEKNRLCPPSSFGNTLQDWATMNVTGLRNSASFSSELDIKAWTDSIAVNPARIPPDYGTSPELDDALARLQTHLPSGLARLAELSDQPRA
jgi:hypothetical protein